LYCEYLDVANLVFLLYLLVVMETKIVKLNRSKIDSAQIKEAARLIDDGRLAAFPTETVYGIACRVKNDSLAKLNELKNREPQKHYTLHIANKKEVEKYVPTIGLIAKKLIAKGWPGPLTVIFELDEKDMAKQQKRLNNEVCCDGASYSCKAIITLKYCDIQDTANWMYKDNSYSEVIYLPDSTYHNRYTNPDFVNTANPKGTDNEWATSDDGFMLDDNSYCISAGDDITGSPHYISEDITGNDRKIGSEVDIGAYEYDPN